VRSSALPDARLPGFAVGAALLYSHPVNFLRSLLLVPCVGLALVTHAAAASPAVSTLGVDEIHPGQKAVVRTVFQGSRVDEFEAEIVGVLRMGRAQGDMILARATSERVLRTGVALGMSGSPVYVDGRLIGALSSGWPFSREPVFGVTPIGEMLELLKNPSGGTEDGTAGPSGADLGSASRGARFGEFHWDGPGQDAGLEEGAGHGPAESPVPAPGGATGRRVAGIAALPARLALPLACGGVHPAALDIGRGWLEPLGLAAVPGGRATAKQAAPDSIVPGSAVAIDVMSGDLQLSALGTVTYRDGDQVLIFGHPFFQSGEVRLPLSTAEITTVLPSQFFSFKVGASSRPAGVVTQDRRAGVAGRLGGSPRLLPVAVNVARPGRPEQKFRYQSIEDRALAPVLLAMATLNSVLESGGTGANQTLSWTVRLHRPGVPPLALTDVEAGDTPPTDLGNGILAPLRFLYNNPYARLALDSVVVSVAVEPGREQWTLRSARVLDAAVRPGGRMHIEVELERWRGGREVREFTLGVPEEAPDGSCTLLLGGASEFSRFEATHLPGRYRPTSLDDAWRRLAASRTSDGLYAGLFAPAPEITSDGLDYPELPLSALALLASGQRAGEPGRPGDLAKLDETRLPLAGLLRGALLLSVNVDRKAP